MTYRRLLYELIASRSIDLQKQQQHFDFDAATLQDLLDHADMGVLVKDSLAFVHLNATVADAKRAMDQTENCQDVFVTQTETKEGRLEYLSN